jgi:glutathione S-transferase
MTITLHHDGPSTCSQKVRLVLAEKSLDYESHVVNLQVGEQHDPEYVKLNPNHVVPTLEHEGNVFIESALICEYLDDAFPQIPLKPTDAAGRHAMRTWTQRFDAFHQHAGALTYAIGIGPMVLQQGPEAIAAQLDGMPDAAKREQKRVVIEQGVKAPSVAVAVHAVVRILDQMQFDLSSHAWLAGGDLSLADLAALPYVLRLDSLAMTPLLEARPEVAAWFTRMQARPSYEVAIKSQVPEMVIALLRKNGQAVWENVAALAN